MVSTMKSMNIIVAIGATVWYSAVNLSAPRSDSPNPMNIWFW